MKSQIIPLFLLIGFSAAAQSIDVEYDKDRDLSRYKTFSIGGSEVTTPKDQQLKNELAVQKLVIQEIEEELREKGLQQVDSAGDLVVTFIVGAQDQTDVSNLGPLGMTPNNSSQTWTREFIRENLVIDLNDRSNNLIWRVNASSTNGTADMKNLVDQIVTAGFKKFSLKPKKVKKKK